MGQALAIGGKVLKGAGSVLGGFQQSAALKDEARQFEAQGVVEQATSQREAMEQRRQGRLLQSRALAVAAASGGGADDPTVVNIMSDLEAEGEYRALTALYEGDTEAQGLRARASSNRRAAKGAKMAGIISGAASLLDAGSSLSDSFGGKKKGS